MSFTLKQQVEIEQITDFSKADCSDAVMPRWQRKALAARTPTKSAAPSASAPAKTPSKTPKKCGTPKVRPVVWARTSACGTARQRRCQPL